MERFRRHLAPILFALLLAASLIAAGVVLGSRGPELALEAKVSHAFVPGGGGNHSVAKIHFFVRQGDPAARVEIVGQNLKLIRTLAPAIPLEAGRRVSFRWNGRTDAGHRAPPGEYRLRVIEPSQDRDIVYPVRIHLRQ